MTFRATLDVGQSPVSRLPLQKVGCMASDNVFNIQELGWFMVTEPLNEGQWPYLILQHA